MLKMQYDRAYSMELANGDIVTFNLSVAMMWPFICLAHSFLVDFVIVIDSVDLFIYCCCYVLLLVFVSLCFLCWSSIIPLCVSFVSPLSSTSLSFSLRMVAGLFNFNLWLLFSYLLSFNLLLYLFVSHYSDMFR